MTQTEMVLGIGERRGYIIGLLQSLVQMGLFTIEQLMKKGRL